MNEQDEMAPAVPARPDWSSAGGTSSRSASDPPRDLPMDILLALARDAVAAAVHGGVAPRTGPEASAALCLPADAFVTLTENGELRGCMGTLGADMPIGRAVVRAAGMAAVEDPRFWPVRPAELPRLRLEVSVLGPPSVLEDVLEFVPGRDGIVVEARGRRALLLPQVATEQGWGTVEMLSCVCQKAGLPRDAWRDAATRLSVFEVARISGPAVAPEEVAVAPEPLLTARHDSATTATR